MNFFNGFPFLLLINTLNFFSHSEKSSAKFIAIFTLLYHTIPSGTWPTLRFIYFYTPFVSIQLIWNDLLPCLNLLSRDLQFDTTIIFGSPLSVSPACRLVFPISMRRSSAVPMPTRKSQRVRNHWDFFYFFFFSFSFFSFFFMYSHLIYFLDAIFE